MSEKRKQLTVTMARARLRAIGCSLYVNRESDTFIVYPKGERRATGYEAIYLLDAYLTAHYEQAYRHALSVGASSSEAEMAARDAMNNERWVLASKKIFV